GSSWTRSNPRAIRRVPIAASRMRGPRSSASRNDQSVGTRSFTGAVAVLDADSDQEAMLFIAQGGAAFGVELGEDLIHQAFLGGLARLLPPAAPLRAAPSPTPESALAIGTNLRCATLKTRITFGEVVPKDTVLEKSTVLEEPGLRTDHQLDQD